MTDVLALPWQVSLLLGCVFFAVLRWILPSFLSSSPMLNGIASLSHSAAWLPLVFFWFCGLIAFAVAKTTNSAEKIEAPRQRTHAKREPIITAAPTNLDNRWGVSNQNITESVRGKNTFDVWSVEALRALEWKRFELLCAKYYEVVGFKSETIRCGADGGIDVKLFKHNPSKPLAVVQCKAWNARLVGVKEVRELLGVMASEKISRGVFLTTGSYSKDAVTFGAANPMQLLDGPGFVKKIQELSAESQAELLDFAFEGDYTTPTCASCGIKMVKRESPRGVFWGCRNYPRCKSKFGTRE
ncbi:MAG: restriction endonuclease [Collimonas sp.]|uniref:restriction endonuclease n=1 Tax=Collimonas sp. TaxID=1963772 RepID=UPI0032634772